MKELFISGQPLDLINAKNKHEITIGGESACEDSNNQLHNVCENNLCKHGKCVPMADDQGYECKCKIGYSGPFCDQGNFQ